MNEEKNEEVKEEKTEGTLEIQDAEAESSAQDI